MTMHDTRPAAASDLPRWAWLWLPPAVLLLEYAVRLADEPLYRRLWQSELGPVENATVLVLLPGIAAGVLLLRHRRRLRRGWLVAWILLVTAGAVYFGGEEVSWGQHWLGWRTPEVLARLNDQGETNLHNVSSWFDQKPRLLLELWVLVGGLAWPLLRDRVGAAGRADWARWFWPTPVVVPTALLALLVVLPERIAAPFGWDLPPPIDIRASETQEFYFALFITLYLCSAYRRLKHGAL